MTNWYQMEVIASRINNSLVQFKVGKDVIELYISLPSTYFSDLQTEVKNHYIETIENKPNTNRTLALYNRIRDYLLKKYLEELKNAFCAIAAEPAGKLTKTFTCMGWDFNQHSTPEEVFYWFYNRYNYYEDFSKVIEPLKEKEGFLQKEICEYICY